MQGGERRIGMMRRIQELEDEDGKKGKWRKRGVCGGAGVANWTAGHAAGAHAVVSAMGAMPHVLHIGRRCTLQTACTAHCVCTPCARCLAQLHNAGLMASCPGPLSIDHTRHTRQTRPHARHMLDTQLVDAARRRINST